MAEFCTCGSIKIGGNCTNKSCINRETSKPAKAKASASKAAASVKSQSRVTKTRKSSKVVTYNLYDTENEENIE